MALDNHRWVQLDLQLLAEFRHALCLVLPAAVGEQNERNAVVFQERQGLCGAGNGFRSS